MKPPYTIPSMAEIRALPQNGFTVASTFSGCGGSCTGYRMAGFKVLWANEFVPSAQESYRANAAPGSVLDARDIRKVESSEILAAMGLAAGELDILDGSPPCQAFSTMGRRSKGWGDLKRYEGGARQRNEDMFTEYVRLLRGLQPRLFVAENVSGLIKGVSKGYFLEILKSLKECGYSVACRLLDAQWLGVPQRRARIFFVGVRNDLGRDPTFPEPRPFRYSVRDALPHVRKFSTNDAFVEMWKNAASGPSPTIVASGGTRKGGMVEVCEEGRISQRPFTIPELKRVCGFPADFILSGSVADQWTRLGNSVPPIMMAEVARNMRAILEAHAEVKRG